MLSTEELELGPFSLVLMGTWALCCGISQCALVRAGDCPAGPQLLPALVSALQRMVLVTFSPNREEEAIPAPKDLRSKRDKG